MKKFLMLLFSMLVIATAVIVEGGSLTLLLGTTAAFILIFGVFFSTLFTFTFAEIVRSFKNAFSKDTDVKKFDDYKTDLSVVKSISKSLVYWSVTTVFLGLIFVLSNVTTPEHLGKSIAVICLALLYGFGANAVLIHPMECSLKRKLEN